MVPTWYSDSEDMLNYNLVRLLGKGGFSSCYEAVEKDTNQRLAMKVINKSSAKKSQREMIEREVSIQKALNHENVLKLVHSLEDANNFYILTSLCPKETVQIHFKRCGPFSNRTCRYFVFQCFQAVEYLHGSGIIHRDLKPSNFFLDESFTVKLGDFGLAIRTDDVHKQKSFVSGTTGFVAPEVIRDGDVRVENDIWSFGCTVYSIYTGRPPFDTDEQTTSGAELKFNECFELKGREFVEFILRVKLEDRPSCGEIEKHEYLKGTPIVKPSISEIMSKSAPLRIRAVQRTDQRVRNRMLAEALRRMALKEELNP